MSFGTHHLPALPPQPFGQPFSSLSSNQAAKPVPYWAGMVFIAGTFITPLWNINLIAVEQDTGKKGKKIQSGWNIFASFAVSFGHGPADAIFAIQFESDYVWTGPVARVPGVDYVDITIPNRGLMRLYWGTRTQGVDPWLAGSGVEHPGYRGEVYAVFNTLFFGYQKTTAPNVKIIFGRWPQPSWMATSGNSQADANPVAVWSEWMQSPIYGLGLPDARLGTAELETVAAKLQSECVGISPFLDTQESARQTLAKLYEYFQGYTSRLVNGKLAIGLIREVPANAALVEITENDLLTPIQLEVDGWQSVSNKVTLTWTNRALFFLTDSLSAPTLATYDQIAEMAPVTMDRTWITRRRFARVLATLTAAELSLPRTRGKLRIRASSVAGLKEGAAFRISYGHYGWCHVVCRCDEIVLPAPDKPEAEVSFYIDRASLQNTFTEPVDFMPPPEPVYAAEAVVFSRAFELPFWGARKVAVGILAARPNMVTSRLTLWRRMPSGTFGPLIASGTGFSKRGHLLSDYGITPIIDQLVGFSVLLDGVDTTLPVIPLADALTNNLMILVGDELMSCFGANLVAPAQYQVYAIRSRMGSLAATHLTGEEVWFFDKASLPIWVADTAENPLVFKLQPWVFGEALDLSVVAPISCVTDDLALRPPAPLNLCVDDVIIEVVASLGATLLLEWDASSDERTDFWPNFTTDLSDTVLEFYNAGNVLSATRSIAFGTGTFLSYTAAMRVTDFGSDQSCTVKAFSLLNGHRSKYSSNLKLTLS